MQSIGYVAIALVCIIQWTRIDALSITCSYDEFPFHLVGAVYRCAGKVIVDQKHKHQIIEVYGTHLHAKGNTDVQGLIIKSQNLKSIPTNIGSFFPDMKVLNFPQNSISTVTNKDLIPFPNLEFLALYGNRITSLDSDLFVGMKALKFVNLGQNRIKHVGHDIVLPPTAQLYLYSNLCVDKDAETELAVTYLRLNLMMNCPPTEKQQATGSVDSLPQQTSNERKYILKSKYLQLAMRVSFSEAWIDATRCLKAEDPSVYV